MNCELYKAILSRNYHHFSSVSDTRVLSALLSTISSVPFCPKWYLTAAVAAAWSSCSILKTAVRTSDPTLALTYYLLVTNGFLPSFYSPWHTGNRRRQRAYKQLRSSWAACKSFNIIQSRKYSLEEIKLFKLSRQQWAQGRPVSLQYAVIIQSAVDLVNGWGMASGKLLEYLSFHSCHDHDHFTPQQHSQSRQTVPVSSVLPSQVLKWQKLHLGPVKFMIPCIINVYAC